MKTLKDCLACCLFLFFAFTSAFLKTDSPKTQALPNADASGIADDVEIKKFEFIILKTLLAEKTSLHKNIFGEVLREILKVVGTLGALAEGEDSRCTLPYHVIVASIILSPATLDLFAHKSDPSYNELKALYEYTKKLTPEQKIQISKVFNEKYADKITLKTLGEENSDNVKFIEHFIAIVDLFILPILWCAFIYVKMPDSMQLYAIPPAILDVLAIGYNLYNHLNYENRLYLLKEIKNNLNIDQTNTNTLKPEQQNSPNIH